MTLLEKCQKWHEAGQFPKIIEALEALGEDGRTPELASELARAYNNEADPNTSEGRLMLHRAIELLEPHEEHLVQPICGTSAWAMPTTISTRKGARFHGSDERTKPNPRTRMPKNSWRTVSSA